MPESVLVLTHAEEAGSTLGKASLEAVTAGMELAAQVGGSLAIGIVGADPEMLARSIAGIGARILGVAGEAFAQARYASDAAACDALCKTANPTLVIAPHSSRMARFAAGLADRIGGCIDTHITSIQGSETIQVSRWFYRQRIEAAITRSKRPWVFLLESGTYEAFAGVPAEAQVELVPAPLPTLRTRVTGTRVPLKNEQTIRPDSRMLFVAGAGWTKKQPDGEIHAAEAGDLILNFLHRTGASLGSSKSLVDQGGEGNSVLPFLTHMNQVGQTGSTPRHPKGLATCCHGEEPHVVGWRFIGERRAISLDPNCGWARGKADVVYVADAFKVIARMNELLDSKR